MASPNSRVWEQPGRGLSLLPRSEIVQFYSICKALSYVLASLLMALESLSLPLLIFEIRDRSVIFRL